jgi:DNA (cytosine-5)-methyltransferase 1
MIARRDQDWVKFPAPTHNADGTDGLQPWISASEIIAWDFPIESIFAPGRKKLADGTLQRVAKGVDKFVWNDEPFIVRHGHYSKRTGAGLREGCGAGTWRGQPLTKPLATLCATNDKNLIVPWIVQNYGGMVGNRMSKTLGTITAKNGHALGLAELSAQADVKDRSRRVDAFLLKYFGTSYAQSLRSPLGTLTRKDRYALVEVHGVPHRIVDIGMRMLQPHELYAAQGFGTDYRIHEDSEGKAFTKTAQIALVGNSVSPMVGEALIRSQVERAA